MPAYQARQCAVGVEAVALLCGSILKAVSFTGQIRYD